MPTYNMLYVQYDSTVSSLLLISKMFPWYVPPSKASIGVGSPGDIHIVSSNTKSFHVRSSVDRSRRFDMSKIRTVFRSTNPRTSATFPLRDVAYPGIPTPSHEIQCAACSKRGNCMTYLDSNWRRIVFASSPTANTFFLPP